MTEESKPAPGEITRESARDLLHKNEHVYQVFLYSNHPNVVVAATGSGWIPFIKRGAVIETLTIPYHLDVGIRLNTPSFGTSNIKLFTNYWLAFAYKRRLEDAIKDDK